MKPNLLFLLTDQQRHDTIRVLGNPVIRTPNLDRLAAGGTAFERAMVPAPECVPSRCCFTHGQYPAQTGCYSNATSFPDDGRETLMAALARTGYCAHGIGKYHFHYADRRKNGELNGFTSRDRQEELSSGAEEDDYLRDLWEDGFRDVAEPHGVRGDMYYFPQVSQLPARVHPTQWVGDRAVNFLRQRTRGEPWYAFVSFIHPHPPFCPPSPWHKLYRDIDVPMPHVPHGCEGNWIYANAWQNRYKRFDKGRDQYRMRLLRAYYYACISFVDFQIGRILNALEESGEADNTLVVFSSDHGELLGDFGCVGKRTYHDAASRVPLLLRWPGHVPCGKRCRTPASLLDVTRTLLDAASTEFVTHRVEGENLAETANRADEDRVIFSQLNCGENAIHTAVSSEWKYVYSAPDNRELLFDLARDPGETTDLYGGEWATRPVLRHHLERLRGALLGHLHRLGETASTEDGRTWRPWPRKALPANPWGGLLYQDTAWTEDLLRLPGYEDPRDTAS